VSELKKVSEFQEHAHQCRILAASASNRAHREMLSRTAEAWDALAKDREQRLSRQKPSGDPQTENSDDGNCDGDGDGDGDGKQDAAVKTQVSEAMT
jgi:hypothetical protein